MKRIIAPVYLMLFLLASVDAEQALLGYKHYWKKAEYYLEQRDLDLAEKYIVTAITTFKENGGDQNTEDFLEMNGFQSRLILINALDRRSSRTKASIVSDKDIGILIEKIMKEKTSNLFKAYNQLNYLREIVPNFPGLKNIIEDMEIELGMRMKTGT